jgi:hypothetical protein
VENGTNAPLTEQQLDEKLHLLGSGTVSKARPADADPVPAAHRSILGRCMSSHSNLDRESFQELLANAFAVQESGLDTRALATVVDLQRLIATGDPDVDRAMHLIAESARNVANATGIAIALLKGDQLVYRAGSGSGAPFVGRHVTAILSVSEQKETRGEILRVENAETDTRIEAAVCRQFETQSLLILPIYQEHALAGVLEVFFDEEHVFQDREVRTYRLMTSLVEEAMFRSTQIGREEARQVAATPSPATAPQAIEPFPSWMQTLDDDESAPQRMRWIDQLRRAGTALGAEFRFVEAAAKQRVRSMPTRLWIGHLRRAGTVLAARFAETAATIGQRVRSFPLRKLRPSQLRLNLAIAALALAVAAWFISYSRSGRTSASLDRGSSPHTSNDAPQPVPTKSENSASNGKPAAIGTETVKPSNLVFRRVRVGPNEIDYIAEDVTIRHFVTKAAPPRPRTGYKQVDIGSDVTVRYFAPKPTVASQSR